MTRTTQRVILFFPALVVLFTFHGTHAADNPLSADTITRITITTGTMTSASDTVVLGSGLRSVTLVALLSDQYENNRGHIVAKWSGTPLGSMVDTATSLYLTLSNENQPSGWIFAESGDPLAAPDSIYILYTSESAVITPAAKYISVNTRPEQQYSLSGRKLPPVTGQGIAVSAGNNRRSVIIKQ